MSGKRGRPPKYSLERTLAICTVLQEGGTRRMAYESAGVGHTTFALWMNDFPAFAEAVEKAEALAVVRCVETLNAASDTDWRAAAWWLERRYPQEWGKKRLVEGAASEELANAREELAETQRELTRCRAALRALPRP